MTTHVFTYGSLMFDDVWTRVVDGRYASRRATLAGHRRHAIDAEDYPGIVAHADASVDGVLHLEVDDADVARLDRFEGDDYERIVVDVVCDDGVVRRADTYLYRRHDRLVDAAWDPERFALDRFLATYCRDRLDR